MPASDGNETRRPALRREAEREREHQWKTVSAGAVGIEMAVAILIGVLAGQWLDGRFGTDPILTIAGVLVGTAAAFKGLIRVARQHQRDMRRQADEDQSEHHAEHPPARAS